MLLMPKMWNTGKTKLLTIARKEALSAASTSFSRYKQNQFTVGDDTLKARVFRIIRSI